MVLRHRTVPLIAAILVIGTGLGLTSASVASAATGPIFTVMNTSETLPDGVWFRNSAHTADANQVTGHGVSMNEQVQLECYAWGDAVGPYNNKLWYYVLNVTRPINDGVTNQGYLNAHYINDGMLANQIDSGVPQCDTTPYPPPQNPTYDRTGAVNWALANAQDPQGSGARCTWFVSSALWAGGMPQTSSWQAGTYAATYVQGLVNYLEANYSATLTDITSDLTTNAVPLAAPGDIIVYSWNGDGTLDHMAFVVDDAPGLYPEVSEWGQFNFNPWDKFVHHPSSPYVKRGWTWSAMQNEWLQKEHPDMTAYLLHIPGGHF